MLLRCWCCFVETVRCCVAATCSAPLPLQHRASRRRTFGRLSGGGDFIVSVVLRTDVVTRMSLKPCENATAHSNIIHRSDAHMLES